MDCNLVICAHCTSMAGLGEVCSHTAAVLFLMETNTKIEVKTSCSYMYSTSTFMVLASTSHAECQLLLACYEYIK